MHMEVGTRDLMRIAKVEALRIRLPERGEPGIPERPREPGFQTRARIVQPYSIFEDRDKARDLFGKTIGYGPHFGGSHHHR